MGLRVVADLCGEDVAKLIQLQVEYDPEPPFPGGTPKTSDPAIVQRYRRNRRRASRAGRRRWRARGDAGLTARHGRRWRARAAARARAPQRAR